MYANENNTVNIDHSTGLVIRKRWNKQPNRETKTTSKSGNEVNFRESGPHNWHSYFFAGCRWCFNKKMNASFICAVFLFCFILFIQIKGLHTLWSWNKWTQNKRWSKLKHILWRVNSTLWHNNLWRMYFFGFLSVSKKLFWSNRRRNRRTKQQQQNKFIFFFEFSLLGCGGLLFRKEFIYILFVSRRQLWTLI